MYQVFVILAVIVAILLTFIVLIQESKGGGLASNFSASNAIMGVRKTTDFVERATWTLAALLVVLSVATVYVKPEASNASTVVTDMKVNMPELPTQQKGAAPAAPAQQAPAQK